MNRAPGDPRLDRYGAAGVLGVALPVAGLAILPIWDFPGTDASGRVINTFLTEHSAALVGVMLMNTVGVALWAVLAAGAWLELRRWTGGGTTALSAAPACFAMGIAAMVALILAGFAAFFVLMYRPRAAADARLLYDVTFGLLAVSGAPTAVALGAYAAAAYRREGRDLRASAGVAVVAAAGHLVLLVSLVVPRGFLSLEGAGITVIPALLFAWVLVTGIALLRHAGNAPSTLAAPT